MNIKENSLWLRLYKKRHPGKVPEYSFDLFFGVIGALLFELFLGTFIPYLLIVCSIFAVAVIFGNLPAILFSKVDYFRQFFFPSPPYEPIDSSLISLDSWKNGFVGIIFSILFIGSFLALCFSLTAIVISIKMLFEKSRTVLSKYFSKIKIEKE